MRSLCRPAQLTRTRVRRPAPASRGPPGAPGRRAGGPGRGRTHQDAAAVAGERGHRLAVADTAPRVRDQPGQGLADAAEVADAGGGDVDRGQARDVRLVRGDLGRAQLLDGQAVFAAALGEGVQPGEFALRGGDDQLAGDGVRDAVLGAEPRGLLGAGQRVAGLERAGAVVDAAVDDAAVAPGLVAGGAGLLLDHRDPGRAGLLGEGVGRGQAEDAGADHDHVFGRGHGCGSSGLWCARSPHSAGRPGGGPSGLGGTRDRFRRAYAGAASSGRARSRRSSTWGSSLYGSRRCSRSRTYSVVRAEEMRPATSTALTPAAQHASRLPDSSSATAETTSRSPCERTNSSVGRASACSVKRWTWRGRRRSR